MTCHDGTDRTWHVTTLEDMHGGEALRVAQEAQRNAERESATAKAEIELLREHVEALRIRPETVESHTAAIGIEKKSHNVASLEENRTSTQVPTRAQQRPRPKRRYQH